MKWALVIIGLGVVAFAVTMGIYVGGHLSNEAMAVLTGAVCGVGAVLPATIIGALSLLRRRDQENAARAPSWTQQGAPPQYPPIIVVAPPASPNALPAGEWQKMYPQGFNMPVNERQFSVIGTEEGVWNDERHNSWQ